MKKAVMKAVVAMATVALVSPAARAAEATVGLDLASAYVFRGVTFNDGLVAQPSLEVAGLPVTLGVWANNDIDDYNDTFESGQFSEVDLYASYAIPVEGVDASIGYTEYTYPGAGSVSMVGTNAVATRGIADREVSASLGLDAPLAPSIGLYYGLDGAIEEQFYADLSVGHDLDLAEGIGLSLGALVSYKVQPDGSTADDGFDRYELSASVGYSIASVGVTYIGEIDDDVLMVDEDVVVSAGISHSF